LFRANYIEQLSGFLGAWFLKQPGRPLVGAESEGVGKVCLLEQEQGTQHILYPRYFDLSDTG